jgi:hypothetical protein
MRLRRVAANAYIKLAVSRMQDVVAIEVVDGAGLAEMPYCQPYHDFRGSILLSPKRLEWTDRPRPSPLNNLVNSWVLIVPKANVSKSDNNRIP